MTLRSFALSALLVSSPALAAPVNLTDISAEGGTALPLKNLDDWKMAGPGEFALKDGVLTAKGGMGLLWHTKKLANFSLELEFFTENADWNSGIFVRFPDPGDDPWVAVKKGYEVQIAGQKAGAKTTGAIYDIQTATKAPLKVGEWNRYQIIAAEDKIAVRLNGQLINIFETQKGRGNQEGHFGLQNHDEKSQVQFRNIKVQELPDEFQLLEVMPHLGIPRYQWTKYWALRTPADGVMLPKRGGGLRQGGKDWYRVADHGPVFSTTFADWYEGKERPDGALKGLAIYYSAVPTEQALFNMETLALQSATPAGTALHGTAWAGGHGPVNKFLNKDDFLFNTVAGPAWADEKGDFTDSRALPGHGNFSYLQFDGYTRTGNTAVLDYTVHGTKIHDAVVDHPAGLNRFLEIAPNKKPLVVRLASTSSHDGFSIKMASSKADPKAYLSKSGSVHYLHLAPSFRTRHLSLLYTADGSGEPYAASRLSKLPPELSAPISKETFEVKPTTAGAEDTPYQVDLIPIPPLRSASPYESSVRTSDVDFLPGGDQALVTTWDGEIWSLSGLNKMEKPVWRRFATGTFEPLGIKVVEGEPYISARDGIWKLIDFNGDGEADRFEVFNNDILITNNFHEFQFGLETDAKGNFYTAKASPVLPGGRGFDKIVPHNGVVAKISPDGEKFEVVATGLRAPGGIGISKNGEITTGENEGTWQPCCKVNYTHPDQGTAFFGTEDARHGVKSEFREPIVYLPMSVDNSGGQQLWVPKGAKIGIPEGELLHLSYGKSSIYHVLREKIGEHKYQGFVAKLPLKLGSSAQRATFHPDGSLFVTGFRGWQTNAATEAAIQRIRFNEEAIFPLPTKVETTPTGLRLTFKHELDEELATDPGSFTAERWNYVRSKQYGSGHFSADNPDQEALALAKEKESKKHRVHDTVEVTAARLLEGGKTVEIDLAGHKPSHTLKVEYDLETVDGDEVFSTLHGTIHEVPAAKK